MPKIPIREVKKGMAVRFEADLSGGLKKEVYGIVKVVRPNNRIITIHWGDERESQSFKAALGKKITKLKETQTELADLIRKAGKKKILISTGGYNEGYFSDTVGKQAIALMKQGSKLPDIIQQAREVGTTATLKAVEQLTSIPKEPVRFGELQSYDSGGCLAKTAHLNKTRRIVVEPNTKVRVFRE